MKRLAFVLFALGIASPAALAQQTVSAAAPPPSAGAPREARQFDFLIGQWQLEVRPKVGGLVALMHGSPRLAGTWKAWRAMDGFGVEDELRIVDASGNPHALTHALRVYSRDRGQWLVNAADAYRGRVNGATAQWQEGEMRVSGSGTDAEGKPYQTRTRFFEIEPESFRMQQDRSSDGGATWDESTLAIDATRVAATAPR